MEMEMGIGGRSIHARGWPQVTNCTVTVCHCQDNPLHTAWRRSNYF